MASKMFVSGRLVGSVSFNDRTDQYKVKLCQTHPGSSTKNACEVVNVGLPGSGPRSAHGKRLAVDDPRALRNAVHAAISFARDDIQEYATHNRRGSGWLVRPLRRRKRR